MFKFFGSKAPPEINEIFRDSNSQILLLDKYRPLQKEGRFEALLFCAVILFSYKKEYSNELISKYFRHLNNIRNDYNVNISSGKTVDLINNRIKFYEGELYNFFNSEGFINDRIYNVLYEKPLTFTPQESENFPEVIKFSVHFAQVVNNLVGG